MEELLLLNVQVHKPVWNGLTLATISWEACRGHRWAPYLADQSTRPWIGSAAGGTGINLGEPLVGELNDGHPRRGLTEVTDAKSKGQTILWYKGSVRAETIHEPVVGPIPKTLADKEYLHHWFDKCEFCASSHTTL